MQKLVLIHSNEGDVVFDPFMGRGSVGIACASTNRDFIGVEVDKKYFDIASKRIKESNNKLF
jgi:site-specific DNA-methyltransferase (adenine-specific)